MSPPPAAPKIYHITHVDNLPGMVAERCLWSDAARIARGIGCALVGMSQIKERRLTELAVRCHPGTMVGEYVPFYFCPRSIMLYLLHKGNHPELSYHGGQRPIVHLEADLGCTVSWADANGVRWAFSDGNAGARYPAFYNRLEDLDALDWAAISARDFRDPAIKEGKQAEFLLYGSFPWELVGRVGVNDRSMAEQVTRLLARAGHCPPVAVERSWYY